ncbi:hypothetical protein [Speluncibacter jeojiensis]|uniref:DUF5666 domain-containing protein n=1 Tax=Speluncibacter jeojiensis TaxID=2710754 RepID=A0A9X4REK5_9ACTN|nr:hypothetical protein [Corynebacteriales bacterium D3-21]
MPTQIMPAITDDAPAPGPSGRKQAGKGPLIAIGASVVALVIGAFGGYLIGSGDNGDSTAAASAAPLTTAAPVVPAGQTTSTTGAVDSVGGGSLVLLANDKSKVTVHTSPTTKVITLRGNALTDVHAGDSAVVTGSRTGDVVDADLIIAGGLPGLVPTSAAPVPATQDAVVKSAPIQQQAVVDDSSDEPAQAQSPTVAEAPAPAPQAAAPAPQPAAQNEIGPKQQIQGPTGDYGPKQDNYGPKQDSYGPKQDSYGPKCSPSNTGPGFYTC